MIALVNGVLRVLFCSRMLHNELQVRFDFFCKAALEFLLKTGRQPDILHCHDWSTAHVAKAFWEDYQPYGLYKPKVRGRNVVIGMGLEPGRVPACLLIKGFLEGVTALQAVHAQGTGADATTSWRAHLVGRGACLTGLTVLCFVWCVLGGKHSRC